MVLHDRESGRIASELYAQLWAPGNIHFTQLTVEGRMVTLTARVAPRTVTVEGTFPEVCGAFCSKIRRLPAYRVVNGQEHPIGFRRFRNAMARCVQECRVELQHR